MEVEILIGILAVPGNNNHPSGQLFQNGHRGVGCTAAAQNQNFFACHLQPGGPDHGQKSEIVRIVTDELAIPADDGIDGSKLFCPGGHLV